MRDTPVSRLMQCALHNRHTGLSQTRKYKVLKLQNCLHTTREICLINELTLSKLYQMIEVNNKVKTECKKQHEDHYSK